MKILTKSLKPPSKWLKQAYLYLMMFFVGRAMQAAYRVDEVIKDEIDGLGDDFSAALTVCEKGPSLLVRKIITKKGKNKLKYCGTCNASKTEPKINIIFKNIEVAILLLTFQESTCQAEANARWIIKGPLDASCAFSHLFDRLEIYLLPRFIAKIAVKRYQSPKNKWKNRLKIYLGIITG